MQKLCGKDSHTRDGFLELFVSVNSGKVKLRVQLRIVAFPPRAPEAILTPQSPSGPLEGCGGPEPD